MCTFLQTCTHSCFRSYQCVRECVCLFTWHCTHVCVCALLQCVHDWTHMSVFACLHTHANKLRVSVYKLTSWMELQESRGNAGTKWPHFTQQIPRECSEFPQEWNLPSGNSPWKCISMQRWSSPLKSFCAALCAGTARSLWSFSGQNNKIPGTGKKKTRSGIFVSEKLRIRLPLLTKTELMRPKARLYCSFSISCHKDMQGYLGSDIFSKKETKLAKQAFPK